jgi:outer membrane protein OmpA-like peptidoglycan-associated protein
MRHQNIKFAVLIISLCFSIITGCTVLQGKSVKTYEAEYRDTVQASSDTLKNLKIPVKLKTIIHAQRFDGTPVSIEVVRIERDLTEVTVRTGAGVVPDKRVSTQIHEFIGENLIQQPKDDTKQTGIIGENLIQQPKDDTKQTGNIGEEGIQASFDEAPKQGITEENLDDDSTQELIPGASATDFNDPKQSKPPPKLAEVYTDSAFIIFFNQDSNELSAKAVQKLDRIAGIMLNNQKIEATLNGYTDSYGSPSYNKTVSESRANTVKIYLIGKGVDPSKITTEGYGAQKFLGSNRTREGRQFNRRVEIELNNLSTQ